MDDKWRWNQVELQWELYDRVKKRWYFDHHPLPTWFLNAQGIVTVKRFIQIWQVAETLGDVKKKIFWWSINELKDFAIEIDLFLKTKEFKPLKELSLESKEFISVKELDGLVASSILEKKEYAQESSEHYDPMKALLQAQEDQGQRGMSHIETMEVSGRYRFQVRH